MSGYLGPALVFVAMIVGICFGMSALMEQKCQNQAAVMEVRYEYRLLGGCFFEIDGQFITDDAFRVVGE